MVQLISPQNEAVVSLKNAYHQLFEKNVYENAQCKGWIRKHVSDSKFGQFSLPEPVRFVWTGDDADAEFLLSADENFETVVYRTSGVSACEVYNLFIGRKYYWRVGDSEVRSFTVADLTPRWIFAEGTGNVRDIGGYITHSGKRVKQGLVYRGAELDGEFELTERGLHEMHDVLGVRFDLDLRGSGEMHGRCAMNLSPLGDDVKYERISISDYWELAADHASCARIVRLLLDPANFPIYIHCAVGADRTGSILAIIEGILGMEDEDIFRDYEMTTVSCETDCRTRTHQFFRMFLECFDKYEGNFSEKINQFMHDCGLTDEELDQIRANLLEDVPKRAPWYIEPKEGAVLEQMNDKQRKFEEDPEGCTKNDEWMKAEDIEKETSSPSPMFFFWETDDKSDYFEIAEDEKFENIVYRLNGKKEDVVYGLKVGKKYYWRIGEDAAGQSFVTENKLPRYILAEGSRNVRDIGGFKTIDGNVVKQGMVIRGASIDGKNTLTAHGMKTMHELLAIRTDLDLRCAADGPEFENAVQSPLGESVAYVKMPVAKYGEFLSQKDKCAEVIRFFADEKNYPIFVHDNEGADQTGTVCAVLEALVGMSDQDIFADYERSVIGGARRSRHSEEFASFMAVLEQYEGTLADKVQKHLSVCGITDEEIAKVRSNLLECGGN